ncbi:MAG: hypothetical protein E2O61_06810 [Gammaproteobacteria bacterium]|nr:MAG: hypothetical protein E2O61_06810 [Gammaproteobacteria bacterium]
MITTPGKALGDLAMKLALSIAPETSSAYAMANTGMIAVLLQALGQDSERAVANRLADIVEIKALFTAEGVPNTTARETFLHREPQSLRLSDVMTHHAEGLNLLIELHAWAEANNPKLDQSIWSFLLNHTERDKFDW